MTISGSDRPPGDRAQGDFPGSRDQGKFTFPPLQGDITELSRSMLSRLSHTIETEIVPRFMLVFDAARDTETAPVASTEIRLNERIDEFVRLVVTHDAPVAAEYVSTLRAQGAPLSEIYLDLLGPAARRLGEMWEEDEVSFTDVAIGVCRMHQVLLEFSRCFDPSVTRFGSGRSALIVPAPGETHTFGLFVVVEFLRRAGWHCWTGAPSTAKELRSLVSAQHFDAIGLSVSTDRHLEQTASAIADVRRYSKNPDAAVLLGGRVLNDRPDLVAHLGADDTATDGAAAVRILDRLCAGNDGAAERK